MTEHVVAGLLFLLLSLAAIWPARVGGGEEPADEPDHARAIDELTDLDSLQQVFNQNKGHVRLVALLSPSCGYCVKGYRYMRKILDEIGDERLQMYVVWESMLSGDSKELSERMSRKADDPRMIYQAWDADRITGKKWQEVLQLDGVAWDVYFLYDDTATWPDDGPTAPAYWQHQGQSRTADRLDYDLLKTKIEEMLSRAG